MRTMTLSVAMQVGRAHWSPDDSHYPAWEERTNFFVCLLAKQDPAPMVARADVHVVGELGRGPKQIFVQLTPLVSIPDHQRTLCFEYSDQTQHQQVERAVDAIETFFICVRNNWGWPKFHSLFQNTPPPPT